MHKTRADMVEFNPSFQSKLLLITLTIMYEPTPTHVLFNQ